MEDAGPTALRATSQLRLAAAVTVLDVVGLGAEESFQELAGDVEEVTTRDSETGYLQIGGYPKHGKYRLMKRFLHREVEHKEVTEPVWINGVLKFQKVRKPEFVTYRMEPCGLMLDLMLPMLIRWRRLSDAKKLEAVRDEELRRNEEVSKKAKDIRDGNRVRRITPYIQKRAELIEKGMMQAMKMAAQAGLGMRVG